MTRETAGVLYISYDGLLEPLGESQVVAYLERLAADHRITAMSFEKAADLDDGGRVVAMERRLAAHGVSWIRLRYHKRPAVLSTAFDVAAGTIRGRRVCRRRGVDIVHARGYVPSLIALGSRGPSAARFLFDMRGLWVDEKVEAGHWTRGGILHRMGKWWERRFLESADGIVSLTETGVRALAEIGYRIPHSTPVSVIPTCVDVERFSPGPRDPQLSAALGLSGGPVIGCVGTLSNWYLRGEMLRCLARLTQTVDGSQILVVTREDPDAVRADARQARIPADRLIVTRARFEEMPNYVRLFDAGLFFIQPSLSKRGSAATKLAEFLACGVPVIINDGVGDSGDLVRRGGAGVVLPGVDDVSIDQSLPAVRALFQDPAIRDRCRQLALELFDLRRGVERYRALYGQLTCARHPQCVAVGQTID